MAYVTPKTFSGNVMFALCDDGSTRKVTTQPRGENKDGDTRWHGLAESGRLLIPGFLFWSHKFKTYAFSRLSV